MYPLRGIYLLCPNSFDAVPMYICRIVEDRITATAVVKLRKLLHSGAQITPSLPSESKLPNLILLIELWPSS